jgi:hypothetical protein
VPVMGYVCRICHKFYHSNSGVQLSHCKSLAHFENLQVSGHPDDHVLPGDPASIPTDEQGQWPPPSGLAAVPRYTLATQRASKLGWLDSVVLGGVEGQVVSSGSES